MTEPNILTPGGVPASRILHLASSERWTGVAEPAVSVAALQQKWGCEVWFGCVLSRSFEREAKRRGLRVLDFLYLDRALNPAALIGDIRRLRQFIRKNGIQVVHCHLPHDHWVAALALRGVEQPSLLVRTFHRDAPPPRDPLHRWLFRSATGLAISVSESARQRLEARLGLAPPKSKTVYGGIDADRFHPAIDGSAFRRELGIPPEAPLAGIVARMVAGRGYDLLLKAFELAAREAPELRLALIGRGPLKKPIRAEIARHPFGNRIVMAGYRGLDKLPAAYAALDFHILLRSGSEGSARAVLEALACGKANIVTRQGALPETVTDGKDGLIVEPGDARALAKAMARLASDRALCAAMGREARATIERRFREETRAEAVLAGYAEAWKAKYGGRGRLAATSQK